MMIGTINSYTNSWNSYAKRVSTSFKCGLIEFLRKTHPNSYAFLNSIKLMQFEGTNTPPSVIEQGKIHHIMSNLT